MLYCYWTALTLLVVVANTCQADGPAPVCVTAEDILAGKIRVGFHVPDNASKVQIVKDGVELVRGGVYLTSVDKARPYKLLIDAVVPDAGDVAIHFPFRGKMIKLWVHRAGAGDGGSPSVGLVARKFPLQGWEIAHKLPLGRGERLKVSLTVEQNRFEYSVELPDFKNPFNGQKLGLNQTVKHKHTDQYEYQADLPRSLVKLNNAILLDAGHLIVKGFRFDGVLVNK